MADDILIINGAILDRAAGRLSVKRPGFVRIKAGLISQIGAMADLPWPMGAGQVIDATGALILPGLINCHNHAAMTLFRGLADDFPLMTWLTEHIFPAEARHVTADMVYWCTKLAAAEMILAGTTTVADSYFYEGAAAQAFMEAGLRAICAHGVIDFPAPGVPEPADNLKTAAAFVEQWQGRSELIAPAIFCHSPYTCSPATLRQAKLLARRQKVPFFIHLAETRDEVEQIRARYNTTPVGFLDSLALFDAETICVHCVWVDDRDLAIIADSGAGVVHCPASNMKLAAGAAPVAAMLARGIPVGLGTDGCASNNTLDLFAEMRLGGRLHEVKATDPGALTAGQLLTMATNGGARVLGLADRLGELVEGQSADLILVAVNPALFSAPDPGAFLNSIGGADVATVIVNGRLVMQDRRILTFDVAECLAEVRRLSRQVASYS